MFLYDFATKTAQKPDTVATYIRRNEKIFKNHVERREKQLWLDEKAVKILLKKYPEVQRKKYPWWKNETEFEQADVFFVHLGHIFLLFGIIFDYS